jgi:hypothetical protein
LLEIVQTLCRLRLLRLRGKSKVSTDSNKGNTMANLIIHSATDVSASIEMCGAEKVVIIKVSTDGFDGKQPVQITIFDLPASFIDDFQNLLSNGVVKTAPQP